MTNKGDLISREALKKKLRLVQDFIENDENIPKEVFNLIDNAPTVEPKKEIVPVCKVTFDKEQLQEIVDKKVAEMIERLQGEWVFMRGVTCGGYYKCNKCGEVERAEKNYCPNCGALMMKGGKEE